LDEKRKCFAECVKEALPPHQLRQLGDVGGDGRRFIACQQIWLRLGELALARRSVSGRRWIEFGATAKRPVVCHRGRLNQRNVLIGKSVTKRIEHTSRDDV
jgi:hypothetical protein